ncbi:hypothetical protein VTJ04DRAFT_2649 [Mycothermus thermophilus]|uniref:uncharacterized protein n=1 Tax=Humicola insolens TaxID=85995 RepID=UPI0037448322
MVLVVLVWIISRAGSYPFGFGSSLPPYQPAFSVHLCSLYVATELLPCNSRPSSIRYQSPSPVLTVRVSASAPIGPVQAQQSSYKSHV